MSPPSVRKYAFHMVLAGLRYNACDQKALGMRAYRCSSTSSVMAEITSVGVDITKLISDCGYFQGLMPCWETAITPQHVLKLVYFW